MLKKTKKKQKRSSKKARFSERSTRYSGILEIEGGIGGWSGPPMPPKAAEKNQHWLQGGRDLKRKSDRVEQVQVSLPLKLLRKCAKFDSIIVSTPSGFLPRSLRSSQL